MRTETLADYFNDVSIELKAQVSRTVLLLSAVALSIGALVASLGIAANAAHQIDADLAAATNRTIKVEFSEAVSLRLDAEDRNRELPAEGENPIVQHFPADTVSRIATLDTVQHVGMSLEMSGAGSDPLVTRPATGFRSDNTPVRAVTSGYLAASEVKTTGSVSLLDSNLPVVFLGSEIAANLGIPHTADLTGLSVELNHVQFSVAGFLHTDTSLTREIIVPYQVGLRWARTDAQATIMVHTKIGAGTPVARVLRHVVLPAAPDSLVTSLVVSAQSERDTVSVQMSRQMVWIGLFLIMLTMLLIANSMVVSVTSRTTEIGIRRALGSSRAAVATVFLVEGLLLGFLGGLAGSALSAVVVVGVSFMSGWSAFLNLWWIAAGPIIGLSVGLVASAYPAWRAARVQPAIAVRSN